MNILCIKRRKEVYFGLVFTRYVLDIDFLGDSPPNTRLGFRQMGRGVLPLPTDGGAPLGFEKWNLRGTHFLRKKVTLNGTKIPKFSQNFLIF